MYSNNILNFQESTPILNACIKKSLETYWIHHVYTKKDITTVQTAFLKNYHVIGTGNNYSGRYNELKDDKNKNCKKFFEERREEKKRKVNSDEGLLKNQKCFNVDFPL